MPAMSRLVLRRRTWVLVFALGVACTRESNDGSRGGGAGEDSTRANSGDSDDEGKAGSAGHSQGGSPGAGSGHAGTPSSAGGPEDASDAGRASAEGANHAGGTTDTGASHAGGTSHTGGAGSSAASHTAGTSAAATGGASSAEASGGASSGGTGRATGGDPSTSGGIDSGGASDSTGGSSASASGGNGPSSDDALGAYPYADSPVTLGGTMTFTNVGAPGWWPRRLDREEGDPACDYKDGLDTWGGHCCQTRHETASDRLAPFDEEMTLILKAIDVRQLAIYQPDAGESGSDWHRATAWDERTTLSENLWFTQEGAGSTNFLGDLTQNDCVGYVMQEPLFECGDGSDYYCPNDSGILHRGYSGSKLVVFLASMDFADADVGSCNGAAQGHPGPWVAFVASELVRDGGRKWNGLCNCYSKTGSVGDGCGEINVFEVVMDDNEYSNREFMSTGVRSYQEGHIGGAVCMSSRERDDFAADADVVDACGGAAYAEGPEIVAGGSTDGCPVWRRPEGDRYFFILLDEGERTIQVGIIHPANVPNAMGALLPQLPGTVPRDSIDAMLRMRLPE